MCRIESGPGKWVENSGISLHHHLYVWSEEHASALFDPLAWLP